MGFVKSMPHGLIVTTANGLWQSLKTKWMLNHSDLVVAEEETSRLYMLR